MVLFAETPQAETSRQSFGRLFPLRKKCIFATARPAREPTVLRRPSVNVPPTHEKRRPKASFHVVEVVGVEPTSYSAAKKLSTYLVYLLFLNFATRVNTLCKTQKAEYS